MIWKWETMSVRSVNRKCRVCDMLWSFVNLRRKARGPQPSSDESLAECEPHLGTVPSGGLFVVLRLGVVVDELQLRRADHTTSHPVAWRASAPRAGGARVSSTAGQQQQKTTPSAAKTLSVNMIHTQSRNKQPNIGGIKCLNLNYNKRGISQKGLGSSAVCAAVAGFWLTSMQIALPPRLCGNTAVALGSPEPKASKRACVQTLIKSDYPVNRLNNQRMKRPPM